MYTLMSWYLPGTQAANTESFLNSVEAWLSDPVRAANYGFDFSEEPLSRMDGEEKFLTGREGVTLEVILANESPRRYTSVSVHKMDGNVRWVVEAVLRQERLGRYAESRFFEVHYRKCMGDPAVPAKYTEGRTTPPRLPERLILDGLATKEEGECYAEMLVPDSRQRGQLCASEALLNYPIVYLNKSETSAQYLSQATVEQLLRCSSLCHPIVCDVDASGATAKWGIRVEYPRLSYTAEYYATRNCPTGSSTAGVIWKVLSGNQIKNDVTVVLRDLYELVNEGLSSYSDVDRRKVARVYDRSSQSVSRVAVSETLGQAIQQARRAKGMTQGELAALTEQMGNAENAFNGLLISRLESGRLKRVEIERIELLERCLELPEGHLLRVAEETASEIATRSVRTPLTASRPVAAETAGSLSFSRGFPEKGVEVPAASFEAAFCGRCGRRFSGTDGFCTQCGTKRS